MQRERGIPFAMLALKALDILVLRLERVSMMVAR